MVVLPPHVISELNRLPQDAISSRKAHAVSLLGHLNGINVVLKTNHHVKILLNRVTPSLPQLLAPSQTRIGETMQELFPRGTDVWTTIKPVDKVVLCFSRSLTLATFGEGTCDDPELVRTFKDHTENGESFSLLLLIALTKDSILGGTHLATSTLVLTASACMVASRQMAPSTYLADPGAICLAGIRATSF